MNKSLIVISISLVLLSLGAIAENVRGKENGPIIGIDLGTTYSVVGIYKNGKVEILPNELGNRITPSVVAFTDDEILIGEAAKNQATINPQNTIFSIKRLIGRSYNDPDVQKEIKLLPYKVVSKDNKPYVEIRLKKQTKLYSPEEISAFILSKMKKIAENYLGMEVKHAVITVPAYFNDSQRAATKDAALIAGLNVSRIINEPTAAAIAYGLDSTSKKEKNVLVYDLGGGTFDVSLLNIDEGVFEVIATNGNTHLGGDDFDNQALEHFIKKVKNNMKKDISKSPSALQKLKLEIEKAKRSLSSVKQTNIEIENLLEGLDFKDSLTRAKFEEINSELFKKTIIPIDNILKDGKLTKNQIDEIILVGGSTRIPKIQTLIKDYFDGKEPFKAINPDEAVAVGAAIQAGIIGGSKFKDEIIVIDSNSLSLGIETAGGVMTVIIPRGSKIPTKRSQVFTTYQDHQDRVEIKVYEGERTLVRDNHLLGSFFLSGIPPASKGIPQIEVTFELDENSILNVNALEKTTSKAEKITITNDKGRWSYSEIQKMIEESEKMRDNDKELRETIEARHSLEHYIHTVKTNLKDKDKFANKLKKEDKEIILEKIKELETKLETNTIESNVISKEEYMNLQKDIQSVVDPIFADLYKSTSSSSNSKSRETEEPMAM